MSLCVRTWIKLTLEYPFNFWTLCCVHQLFWPSVCCLLRTLTFYSFVSENNMMRKKCMNMLCLFVCLCVCAQRWRVMSQRLALRSVSNPVWTAWETWCWETEDDQTSQQHGHDIRSETDRDMYMHRYIQKQIQTDTETDRQEDRDFSLHNCSILFLISVQRQLQLLCYCCLVL